MFLDVALAPCLLRREHLAGVVLCVDVLRATSTMVAALENGARSVVPAASIDEAKQLARKIGPEALLAGEQHSVMIEGFDLGNSPLSMDQVHDKTLVLKTTNGTNALLAARDAVACMALAIVNVGASVEFLEGVNLPVTALLAGSSGRVNLEDTMCAAVFLRRFREEVPYYDLSDAARLCLRTGERYDFDCEIALREASHGRDLLAMGLEDDLVFCAEEDACDSVGLMGDGKVRRVTGILRQILEN